MQPINSQMDPTSGYQDLSDQLDNMHASLSETLENLENTMTEIENHSVKTSRITKEIKNNWLNRLINAIRNFVKIIFSPLFMLISYLGQKLSFSKAEVKPAENQVAAAFDRQVKEKLK